MATDNNRPPEARIPQWIATGLVSLLVASALAGGALIRDIDRAVMDITARLSSIESKQSELRLELRCVSGTDEHRICARIRTLEHALVRDHPELNLQMSP